MCARVSVQPQVKIGLITRRVNERQKMDLQINQHGSEPGRERETGAGGEVGASR